MAYGTISDQGRSEQGEEWRGPQERPAQNAIQEILKRVLSYGVCTKEEEMACRATAAVHVGDVTV